VSSLHELEYFLNNEGIATVTLHSQISKESRLRNYEYFRDSERDILLSTDLGARGIHFPKLRKIINYDFPLTICDYLQRAGRTGRAVIFCLFREKKEMLFLCTLKNICQLLMNSKVHLFLPL
jgi:superfamily II DNA/RNA helicase